MNHPGTTSARVSRAGGGFAPAFEACRRGLPPAVRPPPNLTDHQLPELTSGFNRPAHRRPAPRSGARVLLRPNRGTISGFTRGG
jgi:hypothetical protein